MDLDRIRVSVCDVTPDFFYDDGVNLGESRRGAGRMMSQLRMTKP